MLYILKMDVDAESRNAFEYYVSQYGSYSSFYTNQRPLENMIFESFNNSVNRSSTTNDFIILMANSG